MKNKSGFILLESMMGLAISIMIIYSLSYCVIEQFKLIDNWEIRTSAHKFMSLHSKFDNAPDSMHVDGREYRFKKTENRIMVEVDGKIFYAQVSP